MIRFFPTSSTVRSAKRRRDPPRSTQRTTASATSVTASPSGSVTTGGIAMSSRPSSCPSSEPGASRLPPTARTNLARCRVVHGAGQEEEGHRPRPEPAADVGEGCRHLDGGRALIRGDEHQGAPLHAGEPEPEALNLQVAPVSRPIQGRAPAPDDRPPSTPLVGVFQAFLPPHYIRNAGANGGVWKRGMLAPPWARAPNIRSSSTSGMPNPDVVGTAERRRAFESSSTTVNASGSVAFATRPTGRPTWWRTHSFARRSPRWHRSTRRSGDSGLATTAGPRSTSLESIEVSASALPTPGGASPARSSWAGTWGWTWRTRQAFAPLPSSRISAFRRGRPPPWMHCPPGPGARGSSPSGPSRKPT